MTLDSSDLADIAIMSIVVVALGFVVALFPSEPTRQYQKRYETSPPCVQNGSNFCNYGPQKSS